MATTSPTTPPPSRFTRFLSRVRKFLTPKQFSRVRDATAIIPPSPPSPSREPVAAPAPTTRGPPDAGVVKKAQRRIEELKKVEREARREIERIETKVAGQKAPILGLRDFTQRKGFTYTTWFKATGTFGREAGYSALLGEMTELEDFDVPSQFFSGALIGQVKWNGVLRREELIAKLNARASWNPDDFRDVYPKWEYRYYVAEMVGNVVVQIYEHEAKSNPTRKERNKGVMGR